MTVENFIHCWQPFFRFSQGPYQCQKLYSTLGHPYSFPGHFMWSIWFCISLDRNSSVYLSCANILGIVNHKDASLCVHVPQHDSLSFHHLTETAPTTHISVTLCLCRWILKEAMELHPGIQAGGIHICKSLLTRGYPKITGIALRLAELT